jgi:hypothetical protein
MTGSAFSNLDFPWQIRPAIGPAVNSNSLRIIDPFLFVYKEWPLGERRLCSELMAYYSMSHIAPCCSLNGGLEPGLSKTLALPPLGTWTAGSAARAHCRSLSLQEARGRWTKAFLHIKGLHR